MCVYFSLTLKFPNHTSVKVCPQAYAKAHYRGHTYYDKLVRELKDGAVNGSAGVFSKHSLLKPSVVKEMIKKCDFGLELNSTQFTAATLPSTLLNLYTANRYV